MFWKFIFCANIIVLVRYISLIPYKLKNINQLLDTYSIVFDKTDLQFFVPVSFFLFTFAILFMILTSVIIFEKGFRKNIFNKFLLKILLWSFIFPVIIISSVGNIYNSFISNIWQISLKELMIFIYNLLILIGCINLAHYKKDDNENI